jgi:hypothetical protein
MRNVIALALLLGFGAAAQANYAPVDVQRAEIEDGLAVATGPAGATLERDYFRAPPATYAVDRTFPCRLQLMVFEKRRLALSCH